MSHRFPFATPILFIAGLVCFLLIQNPRRDLDKAKAELAEQRARVEAIDAANRVAREVLAIYAEMEPR